MSRQFRSDDTSPWVHKFGYGSDGTYTVSTPTTYGTPTTTFTGTSWDLTGVVGATTGFAAGNLVLIHQTWLTGGGSWELNRITSIPSTTISFELPLQNTYSSGAQIIKLMQYSAVTINATLTAPAFNGQTGGILAFLCNGLTDINATITSQNCGFGGGVYVTALSAEQGDSSTGNGGNSTSANGAGGGGGRYDGTNRGHGAGGGGGGGATAGENGSATSGSSGSHTAGSGGTTSASNASLTTAVFGGSGGGASREGSGATASDGAASAGGIFIFSNYIDASGGAFNISGSQSNTSVQSPGGSSAGSFCLIKAQVATLGSSSTGNGGARSTGSSCYGGAGGNGIFHLDYSGTYTGTTTPTLDVTFDSTVAPSSGAAALFL